MEEHLRNIERRIASGDVSAWPELFVNWRRMGRCDVESLGGVGYELVTTHLKNMVLGVLDECNISHAAFDAAPIDVRLINNNDSTFFANFSRECSIALHEDIGILTAQIENTALGHIPQIGPRLRDHLMAEEHVVSAFRQNENTGDRFFSITEVTEQWGSMQPDVQPGQWITGTDTNGESINLHLDSFNWTSPLVHDMVISGDVVNSETIHDAALRHHAHAQTQLSAQEYADQAVSDFESGLEGREIAEISLVDGWGARLSMPGYMDATDWGVFETQDEAMQYLLEMHSPELTGNLEMEFTLEISCDYLLDLQPLTANRRNPDEDLRALEKRHAAEPIWENLARLVQKRVQHGMGIDDLGREAQAYARELTCKHPGLYHMYHEDSYSWRDRETGMQLTEKFHYYECPDCGYTTERKKGWLNKDGWRRNPAVDVDAALLEHLQTLLDRVNDPDEDAITWHAWGRLFAHAQRSGVDVMILHPSQSEFLRVKWVDDGSRGLPGTIIATITRLPAPYNEVLFRPRELDLAVAQAITFDAEQRDQKRERYWRRRVRDTVRRAMYGDPEADARDVHHEREEFYRSFES